MAALPPVPFASIALTLFVVELTDKDAMFLLSLSGRWRAVAVFAAGALAFVITTAVNVTVGSALLALVPLLWVRLAGGAVMLAFGLWQASHISQAAPAGVSRGEGWRAFFGAVGTLALLDLAGDATQILTVVFVAQYSDALLVFLAACVGLTSAAAAEAALGRILKAALSPRTLSYFSAALLIAIGGALVLLSVV